MIGTVLRAQGGTYEIETPQGIVEASLRGRLKREETRGAKRPRREELKAIERGRHEERTGDKVVVGDRVEVELAADGVSWAIKEVHERQTALVRKAPGKAPRGKVIAANIDRVVIVFAAAFPDPHLRMLDRFLVLCEASGLDALIVANKVDLTGAEQARELFGLYESIGYPVVYASVKKAIGVDSLKDQICGRTSALTGPSGVGKSSLLNAIQPGLALRVASVSDAVQKGRHTTVTAQLIPLECGGYVADTPGLRELGLWGIPKEDLDTCFPEFEPFLGACRYGNSCTHTHEPACAIQEAVAAGEIPASRYDSYCRLLNDEDMTTDEW